MGLAMRGKLKSAKTEELIGCTFEEFRVHIEKQFHDKMTWDNYGEWHVDHIIPCAVFDLLQPTQQLLCFHYSNLQPLWGEENLSKNNSVDHICIEELPETFPSDVIERIREKQQLEA